MLIVIDFIQVEAVKMYHNRACAYWNKAKMASASSDRKTGWICRITNFSAFLQLT